MPPASIDITSFAGLDRIGQSQPRSDRAVAAHAFDRALDAARTQESQDARLREATEQLVGQALFLPLLKQARDTAFKSDLFHGGRGEEAFGAQLDMTLADRMARRDAQGLVDSIVQQITRNNRHG